MQFPNNLLLRRNILFKLLSDRIFCNGTFELTMCYRFNKLYKLLNLRFKDLL